MNMHTVRRTGRQTDRQSGWFLYYSINFVCGWYNFQTYVYLTKCLVGFKNHCFKIYSIIAKFYGRLRLIRSIWRASIFSVLKINWNCNYVGLLHHPFWLQLVLALFGRYFSTFYTKCLAKDHWRGFNTRNAHMVHIFNLIRLKMVYTS